MTNKKQQHPFSRLWRRFIEKRAASASKGEFFLLTLAAALLEGCGGGGGGGGGSSPSSAPPTELALRVAGISPPEEGASDRIKVADIAVTDSDGGGRGLELVGDDAHLFELNTAQTELYLRAGNNLDYETNPRLDVTVRVKLAISVSDDFTVEIKDMDEMLSIGGDFKIAVGAERQYRLTAADLSALDATGNDRVITWRVTDGPDNGYLALESDHSAPVDRFTQEQLETEGVVYIHNGGGGAADDWTVQAEASAAPPQSVTIEVEIVRDAAPARPSYSVNNPWLSALLYQAVWSASPSGASVVVIEYAFRSGQTTDNGVRISAPAWNDDEKEAVCSAMAAWEAVCNIDFIEIDAAENPEIEYWKFPASALEDNVLAYHELPIAGTREPLRGVFGSEHSSWTPGGLMAGGIAYETIIHELGHALGLAHPHENGGSGIFPGVTTARDSYGDDGLNQGIYTVMGYNSGWPEMPLLLRHNDYGWGAAPMAFDIAAVQELYGVRAAVAMGDDTYTLPGVNAVGTYWSCIWDTGGIDTISGVGVALSCEIDLRAADLEGEGGGGYVSYVRYVNGGYTIANTVVIENAIGGGGDDMITGNGADNELAGGGGADTFIFYDNFGEDTITDFDEARDKIMFIGFSEVLDQDEFIAALEEEGRDVIYDFGADGKNRLRIEEVTIAELRSGNFFERGIEEDIISRRTFSVEEYTEAMSGEGEFLFS